ncbi:MAG: glycosyl transferase family 2 [Phycisphaerales bacterium]|nr:MAG: glycosyl transferase family 2 [Phycisphaerales bacterium]
MDQPAAIILAAGKGTRMPGDLPKVVHDVAGAPMVRWVADACLDAGCSFVSVVVGYKQELVRSIFEKDAEHGFVRFCVQDEQLGTGHATQAAAEHFEGFDGPVLLLAGDGPLVRFQTLARLIELHGASGAAATLATTTIDDPTGYGRIVRGADGRFARIVEQKNATPEELAIREVNPSIWCFDAKALFRTLRKVRRNETTGEYYVTDVPALMLEEGLRVEIMDGVPAEEALSVNTPAQREEVEAILLSRLGAGSGAARIDGERGA